MVFDRQRQEFAVKAQVNEGTTNPADILFLLREKYPKLKLSDIAKIVRSYSEQKARETKNNDSRQGEMLEERLPRTGKLHESRQHGGADEQGGGGYQEQLSTPPLP